MGMRRTLVVPVLVGCSLVLLGACGSPSAVEAGGTGTTGTGTAPGIATTVVPASSTSTSPETSPSTSVEIEQPPLPPYSVPPTTGVAAGDPLDGRDLVVVSASDSDPAASGFVSAVGRTVQIRITFRDGNFGYQGTCNSSSGGYTVEDGTFVVGGPGLMSTAMACSGDRLQGDVWLGTFLGARPTVGVDGERVTMVAGARRMVLEPYRDSRPRPLVGTTWELQSVV